jgi:16S rRNA (guanine(966)-N(2))-methyltransferase RsmD
MRVIAGKHRSRKLKEVPTKQTRETKDRVKESIFNSIQEYVYDARVLDLFCGSGSLGIEALSRQAAFCDFNDFSDTAIEVTKDNLSTLNLTKHSKVTRIDALKLLDVLRDPYDIILLDPPYASNLLEQIIIQIAENNLLNEHGIIVVLYSKQKKLELQNCDIIEYKKKTIGITNISYLKWSS